MNISQAKEQIKNAMTAYFSKDEFGNYSIPLQKQRPVFLIGPPGVGKTAIMEQVASELGVGLVSYSMTHHTRQSALGLPVIKKNKFEDMEYEESEYTMSEIIGAVYALMRETDVREGILFLDEINCVSETLAPCMLQFLQYKIFGQHQLPNGWIVVTAGNPPEYNKSVRDFDIVTWDRLKRIDVEPDYDVWKKYASEKGVHPAVLTYLAARKKDFYKVETTVDGKNFVTPRGWDDLSEMIKLYEKNGITVDENLISQYLQEKKIAKDFAIYYDLFNKYRSDYKIDRILEGKAGDDVILRAQNAPLDERMSFLGLMFDAVTGELKKVCEKEDMLDRLTPILKEFLQTKGKDPADVMEEYVLGCMEELEKGKKASALSVSRQRCIQMVIAQLQDHRSDILNRGLKDMESAAGPVKERFAETVKDLKELAEKGKDILNNCFRFCEEAFGDGDEILIFVTELTVNYFTARFIGHYGCDRYYMHNKELQFAERQTELERQVEEINWEL
ncbi:MAG: AAA family ATPase [Firmicutes bacterium]|nr:AAA family ATPase [Bacillota bacterium]